MTDDPVACPRCGRPHDRCTAHNRAGLPCQQWPMRGQRVCKNHGGKKPAAMANAEARVAERAAEAEVRKLWVADAPPVTDWVGELQQLAGSTRHAMNVLGERLDTGADMDSPTALAWARVLREQRQILDSMGRLDLNSRVVELEQRKVDMVTAGLLAVFDVLQPSDAQRSEAVAAFLSHIGRPTLTITGATQEGDDDGQER